MPVILKRRTEIEHMRRTGQVGHRVLRMLADATRPGVTTGELLDIARAELDSVGAVGLSMNYPTYKSGEGFPAEMCISVNEEVVHGIPGPRVLREGDIVTHDLALTYEGFCADTAITVGVGKLSNRRQELLDLCKGTLDLALRAIKPGKRWTDIARVMQQNVQGKGYGVVREFVGHGIGRSMHEDPKVANFVTSEQLRSDFRLRPGMTLAIEPMVVVGHRDVELLDDGWTVVTKDGKASAHFEHTVAVTETGVDVLTDGREPWGL